MTKPNKRRPGGIASAPGGFTVTLENGRLLWISGYLSVISYERDLIVLRLKRKRLRISGHALSLDSYLSGELCIAGEILSFGLEEGL